MFEGQRPEIIASSAIVPRTGCWNCRRAVSPPSWDTFVRVGSDHAFSPRIGHLRAISWAFDPGWDGSHLWCWGRGQPSGLSKGHRSGWFEGQRPGTIPAYGNAIGFGHRNGWRAEGPGSFPVSLARTDGSGLQPSNRFDAAFPGPSTQAGMVRTVGAQVWHLRAPHSTHNHCRYPPQQPHAPLPPQFLIFNSKLRLPPRLRLSARGISPRQEVSVRPVIGATRRSWVP